MSRKLTLILLAAVILTSGCSEPNPLHNREVQRLFNECMDKVPQGARDYADAIQACKAYGIQVAN